MGQRMGVEGSLWAGFMTGKAALLAWVACACLAWGCGGVAPESPGKVSAPALQEPEPIRRFGVVWEDLVVDSGRVSSGESLSHLLDPAGIGPGRIATLAANSQSSTTPREFDLPAGFSRVAIQDLTTNHDFGRNGRRLYLLEGLHETVTIRIHPKAHLNRVVFTHRMLGHRMTNDMGGMDSHLAFTHYSKKSFRILKVFRKTT